MSQVTTFQTVQVCDNFIAQLEWLAITYCNFKIIARRLGKTVMLTQEKVTSVCRSVQTHMEAKYSESLSFPSCANTLLTNLPKFSHTGLSDYVSETVRWLPFWEGLLSSVSSLSAFSRHRAAIGLHQRCAEALSSAPGSVCRPVVHKFTSYSTSLHANLMDCGYAQPYVANTE